MINEETQQAMFWLAFTAKKLEDKVARQATTIQRMMHGAKLWKEECDDLKKKLKETEVEMLSLGVALQGCQEERASVEAENKELQKTFEERMMANILAAQTDLIV